MANVALPLTDEFKLHFLRLWAAGNLTRQEISHILAKRHGVSLSITQLSSLAKSLGAARGRPATNQATVEERMHKASLARWGVGRRDDNPVVSVEPGTFKAPPTGFRLGQAT